VPIDGTGTASVEAVKAPLVPGVQKPPRRVGKRFRDHFVAVPEKRKGAAGRSAAVQALRWLTATTLSRNPTQIVKGGGRGAEPRRGCCRAAEGVE
jgi:hypothetical protein